MRRRARRKNPSGGDVLGVALGLGIPLALVAAERVTDGRSVFTGRGSGSGFADAVGRAIDPIVYTGAAIAVDVVSGIGLAATGWKPGVWRGLTIGAAVSWLVGVAVVSGLDIAAAKALAPPPATNVVLFPGLAVGTVVLVDTVKARFSSPFPLLLCTVDLVLTDTSVVSVRETAEPTTGVHGTIPRDAIVRVVAVPPSPVVKI